ncbi:hypothetical protein D3C71_2110140 [compost metagenome]
MNASSRSAGGASSSIMRPRTAAISSSGLGPRSGRQSAANRMTSAQRFSRDEPSMVSASRMERTGRP